MNTINPDDPESFANVLYNLELGQSANVSGVGEYITRVPGGWIWFRASEGLAAVFVPYNNEFSPARRLMHPPFTTVS